MVNIKIYIRIPIDFNQDRFGNSYNKFSILINNKSLIVLGTILNRVNNLAHYKFWSKRLLLDIIEKPNAVYDINYIIRNPNQMTFLRFHHLEIGEINIPEEHIIKILSEYSNIKYIGERRIQQLEAVVRRIRYEAKENQPN